MASSDTMATTDPGDPSAKYVGSVMLALGADCVVLYFHDTDPVSGTELALFLVLHTVLARASSWDYLSERAEKGEQHRLLSAIRNSRVGYEPQHEIGAEVFGQRKSELGSRLKDQLETQRCIARKIDPSQGVAWFVKKIGGVVAANRDIAKLQRRLQVAGELCHTAEEKGGGVEGGEKRSETMVDIDKVPYAHLPEALLSTRHAVLVRFMGLNSPTLMSVARRVAIGVGSTAGDITGGGSTADGTRCRGMRVRLLAAETCVARHQYEGGALWKAVSETDEARVAAKAAKQALVDLETGHQKRARQHVELTKILGMQRLERQESKQEIEKHKTMVEEAKIDADFKLESTESHEEKLKLFRQRVEQRKRGFQTDHREMEMRARTIWGSRLCKRPTVADLEREKIQLQGKLKELTDFATGAEARIAIMSDQRERQRRRPQESKEESSSTEERPNLPPWAQQQQHPQPQNNGPAGTSRKGARGKRRGGRGPSAGSNGVSSVAARTQSSRDTPPAAERGETISGGVARGSQVGEGVSGAAAPGATCGQASSCGALSVPPGADPKVPTSGNFANRHEKPALGIIGQPVPTPADTQQPSAPVGYHLHVREPEDEPYFVARANRGVRPGGNAPAVSSSTPAAGPPASQLPVASLPPAAQPPAAQLCVAAAEMQASRAPPGFEDMVVPAGGGSHGNLAADSAAVAAASGSDDDDDDGLPRTLEALLVRCDCAHHLKRFEAEGVTARSVKRLTHAQLKEYGVEEEVRLYYPFRDMILAR